MSQHRTLRAQSLSRGTSAQQTELLALIQALRWGRKTRLLLYILAEYFCRGPCPWGAIQGKRTANLSRKRDQKQRINLSPFGSYLLTQEGSHRPLHRTPKRGFPRSQKQEWLTWLSRKGALEPVSPLQVLITLLGA